MEGHEAGRCPADKLGIEVRRFGVEFHEETGQYYLHLYDVTQADLNWENDEVRKKVYEMMHFWFEKGIDGFRLDVINVISKDQRFPDDDEGTGADFIRTGRGFTSF